MLRRETFLWALPIALSAVAVSASAVAQEAQGQPRVATQERDGGAAAAEAAAIGAGGLAEVTVSARRRDESVQDVPLSIQALTGDQIEARGIERVENVVASSPNVVISSSTAGQGSPQFSVRGIPGVGIFVDGVFLQSFVGVGQRSVLEVDRVEVLRGPQGTLFGRDTTGGAFRIFTKLPGDQFGVRASATVGSYERRDVALHVDVPFGETFKSKFSFTNEEREGYVKSIVTGRKTGDVDDQMVRADFLWRPTSRFTARVTGDYTRSRSTQPNYTLHIFDPAPEGIGPGLGFQVPPHQWYEILGVPYNCQSNVPECPGGRVGDLETVDNFEGPPGIQVDEDSYNLKLDYALTDNLTLSSLSNYNELTTWFYINFDAASVDYFSQGTYSERESWSQEFQLSGDFKRINFVTGVYGWNTSNKDRFMRWPLWDWFPGGGPNARFSFADLTASPFCTPVTPGLIPCGRGPFIAQDRLTEGEQEGFAVFGEITFNLTSTLSATLGGRFHDQDNTSWTLQKASDTPPRSNLPGHLPVGDILRNAGRGPPLKNSFNKDTYRFSLSNEFNEDLMVYASFAQGYNAGGVSRILVPNAQGGLVETDFPFDPETINSYEIGLRSDWLDGSLRVNATVFKTDWKDIQLQGTIRDPVTGAVLPTFVTQNAAAAEAKGGELSFVYRPVQPLVLNLDVGFLDTGYTGISANASNDLSKSARFGRAPEHQFSAGAQWSSGISSGYRLMLRADYNYTSGYMRHYIPGDQSTTYTGEKWEVPAFGLLNARAVLGPAEGKWEVSLFASNLTDERYSTGGFMSPLLQIDDGTVGRPREYGVSVKIKFE
jgi:iron complex outermembrane recepter protein